MGLRLDRVHGEHQCPAESGPFVLNNPQKQFEQGDRGSHVEQHRGGVGK